MSNLQRFENTVKLIERVAPEFNELAKIHGAVNFKREASFAVQSLKSNNYLAQVAYSNQDSLREAVLNVAAIGLSLSPVQKLAYLVPRDGKVCLDISYMGYIQLAVDVGAIKWAQAEIVCQNDKFVFNGMGERPEHSFEPFGDRGEIVGAYCLAKTHDCEFITSMMPISEIYGIRNRSKGWKAHIEKGKSTPWVTDESEMIKKTVIKRAYKSWPKSDTRQNRLEQAIDVSNQVDQIDFDAPTNQTSQDTEKQNSQLEYIKEMLTQIDRSEDKFIEHLATTHKRTIESLNDLTEIEIGQAVSLLEQIIESKKKAVNE